MYQVVAWKCSYCGAIKTNKNVMENHEISCLKNPNSKNCLLCTHSQWDEDLQYSKCELSGKKCCKPLSAKCEKFVKKFTVELVTSDTI